MPVNVGTRQLSSMFYVLTCSISQHAGQALMINVIIDTSALHIYFSSSEENHN